MLVKRFIVFSVVLTYLYTLVFGIFMTGIFRIPAPIVLGILLLPFIKAPVQHFAYYKECLFIIIALFLYYIVGMADYKAFFANVITILTCAFYFNHFVGLNKRRFNISVVIVFLLLSLSMLLMILDHTQQGIIDPLRSTMLGEPVKQSPSGIAATQFTFGYQIAAFTAFAFVATFTFRLHAIIKVIVFFACIVCLYLGMNRSAFISFAVAVVIFIFIYYKFKAVLLLAAATIICFLSYTYLLKDTLDSKNNILSKNEAKGANDFNRANMAEENLKICADYPFGLIFYGKTWEDVTYRNPLFTFGLTSHNAYLMFITYLGPFLGLGLLGAIYYRITRLSREIMQHVKLRSNAFMPALCFSFIAVSLNALSHNGWLMSADGPTLFLYFGIMQGAKIYAQQQNSTESSEMLEASENSAVQGQLQTIVL